MQLGENIENEAIPEEHKGLLDSRRERSLRHEGVLLNWEDVKHAIGGNANITQLTKLTALQAEISVGNDHADQGDFIEFNR